MVLTKRGTKLHKTYKRRLGVVCLAPGALGQKSWDDGCMPVASERVRVGTGRKDCIMTNSDGQGLRCACSLDLYHLTITR
jgi:hypothetical protein